MSPLGVNSLGHINLPFFGGHAATRTVPDWWEVSDFHCPHHDRHLWMATLSLFAEEEEKGWLVPDRRARSRYSTPLEPDKTSISPSFRTGVHPGGVRREPS